MEAEIQLRFVQGRAWDSRVIQFGTRCCWSHCEAVIDGRDSLGAMLRGGVRVRSMAEPCYSGVKWSETWTIPATPDQVDGFWRFLADQLGAPYDWRAILSFGLGQRDWRAPGAWFCSELQARALEVAGVLTLPNLLPVERITPRDVYMLIQQLRHAHKTLTAPAAPVEKSTS